MRETDLHLTIPFRQAAGLVILIALLGAAFACWPAARSPGANEKQLRELRGRIEALQKQLEDAEESKSEAADALKKSERAISDANRELRELAAQARETDARLAELRAQSERGQQALGTQQAMLARLLYHQYVGGRTEPLKLLLNREDPNQIARQLHYFAHLSRARAGVISGLRENLAQVKELSQEAERKAAELAAITAEQQVQRQRLEREKSARSATLVKISREVREQRRQIGTLKRDEDRLARLIESLARLVARDSRPAARLRNERVPERSRDSDPRRRESDSRTRDPDPRSRDTDGSVFGELRGRLALPVRGELTSRFGSPRAEGGTSWKGLFIAARAGDEVRAVAAGRVVFADWLRGFGNLLIIDHGGAYMTLYGNNESLYKQVGDLIHSGDAIAAVGNSGGNPDSGLYFELRYQGKPLDPMGWVTVR